MNKLDQCVDQVIACCEAKDWEELSNFFGFLAGRLSLRNLELVKAEILGTAIQRLHKKYPHQQHQIIADLSSWIVDSNFLPSVTQVIAATCELPPRTAPLQLVAPPEIDFSDVDLGDDGLRQADDREPAIEIPDPSHATGLPDRESRFYKFILTYLRSQGVQDLPQALQPWELSICPVLAQIKQTVDRESIGKPVVYSKVLQENHQAGIYSYASRLNGVARWQGLMCLVEFRLAEPGYGQPDIEDYILQGAANWLAAEATYGLNLAGLLIVIAVPGQPAQQLLIKPKQIKPYVSKWLELLGAFVRPGTIVANPNGSTFELASYPHRVDCIGQKLLKYSMRDFRPSLGDARFRRSRRGKRIAVENLNFRETILKEELKENEIAGVLFPNGRRVLPEWPDDEDIYQSGWAIEEDVRRSRIEAQIVAWLGGYANYEFYEFYDEEPSVDEKKRAKNSYEVIPKKLAVPELDDYGDELIGNMGEGIPDLVSTQLYEYRSLWLLDMDDIGEFIDDSTQTMVEIR